MPSTRTRPTRSTSCSGHALLLVEGTAIEVGPGSVVSVDQGREHHFTDITEELVILVVFAPPEVPD